MTTLGRASNAAGLGYSDEEFEIFEIKTHAQRYRMQMRS
jgi:hypothetical protein